MDKSYNAWETSIRPMHCTTWLVKMFLSQRRDFHDSFQLGSYVNITTLNRILYFQAATATAVRSIRYLLSQHNVQLLRTCRGSGRVAK